MLLLRQFFFVAVTVVSIISSVSLAQETEKEQPAARPPNIIFILADDLGSGELGCYGNTFNETPNIDRMAKNGVRFHQAYASAPVCSPYRASFLTGQYPFRHGILDYLRPNSSRSIDPTTQTLPEILKSNGYQTGMIGKWHLSGYKYHGAEFEQQPKDHGFEFQVGNEIKSVGNGANFWPYVFRDQDVRWINFKKNRLGENEYLIDRMNLEAVEFIERNKDEPFFLYLSHYGTHTILNGKKSLVDKYRKKHEPGKSTRKNCYLCEDAGHGKGDPMNHWAKDHNPHLAAMLESIDEGVGKIMDKLKSLGLDENTLIVFTSDNGGETNVTNSHPLRAGKSYLYEGGIRVPLVVQWPNQIPKDKLSKQVTSNIDFLPSFLEAAEVNEQPQQIVDGVSIISNLKDPSRVNNKRTLYWHYPLDRRHFLGGKSAIASLVDGRWKAIQANAPDGKIQLFDLVEDPSEKNDKMSHVENNEIPAGLSPINIGKKLGARLHSDSRIVHPTQLKFGGHFSKNAISSKWVFGSWYFPENGILKRSSVKGENKRVRVKDIQFKNALIRFDFRFGDANEIRLVTGGQGSYNTVVHIRPDLFFVQTASDKSTSYSSTQQGLNLKKFDRDKWYTMTVEFLKDQAIAHVENGFANFSYAKHPIVDRERSYLAIQMDQPGGAIDNFELYDAVLGYEDEIQFKLDFGIELLGMKGRHERALGKLSTEEEYRFRKANLIDKLERTDPKYQELTAEVERQKKLQQKKYPEVFSTIKQVSKTLAEKRKKLKSTDVAYSEMTQSINRSKRAIKDYVLLSNEAINKLPENQKAEAIEAEKTKLKDDSGFRKLMETHRTLEDEIVKRYPEIYLTDKEIKSKQKVERERLKDDPEFKAQLQSTANAVRQAKDYLHGKSDRLRELHRILFEKK